MVASVSFTVKAYPYKTLYKTYCVIESFYWALLNYLKTLKIGCCVIIIPIKLTVFSQFHWKALNAVDLYKF